MKHKEEKPDLFEKFENTVLRQGISTRGGGIEILLTKFGYKNEKMTAYQNYLGGGLLGKVSGDCTVKDWQNDTKLMDLQMELRKYFHSLTNPEEGSWESIDFEQNQNLPVSAY